MNKIIKIYESFSDDKRIVFSSLLNLSLYSLFALYVNRQKTKTETFKKTYEFMGGMYLMSTLSKQPIENFIKSLKLVLPTFLIKGDGYEYQKLSNKYKLFQEMEDKTGIPESTLKEIEYSYKYMKKCFEYELRNEDTRGFDYKKYIPTLNFVLDIWLNKQDVVKPENESLETLINRFKNIGNSELKEKVLKPIIGNLFSDVKIKVTPIYLKGEPGVGKTHYVEQLSKKLKIPLIQFEQESYHDGIGPVKLEKISCVTKLYIKTDSFGILFIDEIDKQLNQHAKTVYNRDSDKSLYEKLLLTLGDVDNFIWLDPQLQINIPIDNIIIICAGNEYPSEIDEKYKPLEDRFLKIDFPPLEYELKLKIVCEKSKKYLNRELKTEELEFLTNLTRENKDPGVRQLLIEVKDYCRKQLHLEIFKGTEWETE